MLNVGVQSNVEILDISNHNRIHDVLGMFPISFSFLERAGYGVIYGFKM